MNYTINWTVNGIGTPAAGQLNGVTVNTPSTNQMTYATTPYQVYVADPITGCSQVYPTPVTVNTSPRTNRDQQYAMWTWHAYGSGYVNGGCKRKRTILLVQCG